MTACLTLLILPIKYIYELQRRSSAASLSVVVNRGMIDGRLWTERVTDQSTSPPDDRDHLIQPIVRR